mmetsp:Transcript_20631/g.22983  ORF Transcript_20631/g.22983 Transcript_20631/m.22983 type:complete len:92 (-) Transcript_20631:51-326(-)|eukprot:CAMPEP_0205820838 /NCGR_PEP_ID=MMETSP0206-20130828/3514_1 /ASSEMBLY_ACC=CAM_ASM_000279 /TAXON_ID=36767 /ORGANISM="Euplotes focardii, Strain TN1" /LENGTH=91 /DNA_ID=CAMNT_0053115913 /DNA_START=1045 /DNA_END=1320 /DNA_ORIENTATION=+
MPDYFQIQAPEGWDPVILGEINQVLPAEQNQEVQNQVYGPSDQNQMMAPLLGQMNEGSDIIIQLPLEAPMNIVADTEEEDHPLIGEHKAEP